MKRILAILLLTQLPCLLRAQTEVAPWQPGVTVEGVTYFLPRTALRFTVTARQTVVTPGELAKYAFRYLRLSDVPTEQSTTWTIESVEVEPFGVPDRQRGYSIPLKGRTLAPLVSLTRDGILLSINTQKQETTLPAPPQGQSAAPLPNPRQYMNQEILSAGSTAKMAELCAQRIYDTRESRGDLISGEAANMPKDGAQLQIMIDQLDQQTAALTQLFAGTTQTSTHVFTVTLDPDEETDRQVLFRFSRALGLVDKDDLSGAPVYVSIRNSAPLPAAEDNPDTAKKKAKLEKGVRYCVPALEEVTVFDQDRTYAQSDIPMGQFGRVEILSETLFDKKATTRATFHQTNGGVQTLEQ